MPNTNKIRKALSTLDFIYFSEIHQNETTDFWHGPGMNPGRSKRKCSSSSCHRAEKEGASATADAGCYGITRQPAPGDSKSMGQIMIEIMNAVINFTKRGGVHKEPIVNLNWYRKYDAEAVAKRINGYFTSGEKERETA